MASPTTNKRCSSCNELQALSQYHRRAKSSDGRSPKCKRCCWKAELKKHYGLSYDEYLVMFRKQAGACAICKRIEDEGGRRRRLSVDHCHYTKKVRGLLCSSCNMGLGKFRDDPLRLQAAADYLKSHGKH